MKFINSHSQERELPNGRWVYNTAEKLDHNYPPEIQEQAGNTIGLIGNLHEATNDSGPLMDARQESGSGMHVADTAANFENKISEVVAQGTDSAVAAGISGEKFLSRMFVPPEFEGYTNMYLLNPYFLYKTTLMPADGIVSQLKEGLSSFGNLDDLFGRDPNLVSMKMAKALLNRDQISESIEGMKSGGGKINNMSLTSLGTVEEIVNASFASINSISEDRAVEFYAKSGYDLHTGERNTDTGAVFWKRWARKLALQNTLYRMRFRQAKNRYKEGYDEVTSNIRSLRQQKEEAIFGIQQNIDQFLLPKQADGDADTQTLNSARKVIHMIINNPEKFISNSRGFAINGITPEMIFGTNFSPLDVLDGLRNPKYEFLTKNKNNTNYLESAITVNNWKFNHYNTLRTMSGLNKRIQGVQKLESTDLNKVELHIIKNFERSNQDIKIENPHQLVNDMITALGSATSQLTRDVQDVIKNGNIYMQSTEIFWTLMHFFEKGNNLNLFDRFPPNLKQQVAQFLYQKRDQLEESLVAGGINEAGTLLWRAKILNQGNIVLEDLENIQNILPTLGDDLRSLEPGKAQNSLQTLKTFIDSHEIFLSIIGKDETEREKVFSSIPELERQVLENIIFVGEYAGTINTYYKQLLGDRQKLDQVIDFRADDVQNLLKRETEERVKLDKIIESGKSGLGDTSVFSAGIAGSTGIDTDGDGTADTSTIGSGSGVKTNAQVTQEILLQIESRLRSGEDGGLLGKLGKIENTVFDIPGQVGSSLGNIYKSTKQLLKDRLQELGISDPDKISELTQNNKPDFSTLASLEVGQKISKDIKQTAESLIGSDLVQQFENMQKAEFVSLDQLIYAKANHQNQLTMANLANPCKLENALFVKKDKDGAVWYHTKTQVIKITKPSFNSNSDQRNMAIWYKDSNEIGLDKKFTVPYTNPDELGIMLTANPENSAAKNNALYDSVDKKINKIDTSGMTSTNDGTY